MMRSAFGGNTGGNGPICLEPHMYCAKTRTCVDPSQARHEFESMCRLFSTGPLFPSYKLIRRVKLTILRGYFFIRLSKARNLKAGDLLALKV